MGKGTLRIIYDLAMREPYSGVVEIQSGEIADDIAYYLTSSDQIPSAVSLGVLFNDDSSVREAGGFIVQLMDGATDETAALLEERIASLPSVTTMLSEERRPRASWNGSWATSTCRFSRTVPWRFAATARASARSSCSRS